MAKLQNLLPWKRRRLEDDLDRELRYHVDRRVQDMIDAGSSEAHARRRVALEFGGVSQVRESVRETWIWRWLDAFVRDVRYAVRGLSKSWGFTLVAVLTLALGVGANAAVFSLFQYVLFRTLPVDQPEQLINLSAPGLKPGPKSCGGVMGECDAAFSYPMFRDLERAQTVLTGIAAHRDFAVNLSFHGRTERGTGVFVSGSYFPVLRLQPALGRLLGPADDRSVGGAEVVVLSHEHWQTQYGGRADVLNDAIVVNGIPMTVVGVAPPGFSGTTFGIAPQVFVPITMRWRLQPWPDNPPENRRGYWIFLFARLKPGVTLEHARTMLDVPYRAIVNDVEAPLLEGMSEQAMARFRARAIGVEPGSRGQSVIFANARAPLTLLAAVTGLMLLITCMNVANLELARAAARTKEMATRLSIGAGRRRLVAQLLTESAVLGVAAALASLIVEQWTMESVRAMLPTNLPVPWGLDRSAIVVTGALALVVTVAIGVLPALHAVRAGALASLKASSGPMAGRGAARFRLLLATGQVALSMALVVLAGLFTKSLANINHVDPGLDPDGLVTFSLSPQRNAYEAPRAAELFDRLEGDIAALPGVTAVTSSTTPLLLNDQRATSAFVEGFDVGPDTDNNTRYDEIGDGYFRALGMEMIAGREFTRADSANAPKVAIVNERFAAKFRLGRDAVGKRMSARTAVLDLEIVGVVRDAPHSGLREGAYPMYFVPHRQGTRRPGFMTFYVRSANETNLMIAIRQVVRRADPNLPIESMRPMRDAIAGATMRERLMGVMTSAFAGLALLVAAVGLYGVLAYTVAQRTAEIGLRMALGATRAGIRWMVLRQVGLIAALGGAVGLAAAIAIGRAAQTLLFGLRFNDPSVLAVAVAVLTLVVSAAGFLPADRAARVDPMRALKYE